MQINSPDDALIFNILVQESPLPVGLFVGENLVIKVANKAMLNAWGKDESIIGKELIAAIPELDGQLFLQNIKGVYQTKQIYKAKEDRVNLLINGTLTSFFFDVIYKPLFTESGEIWGILNNASDVTDLVNARVEVKDSETLFRKMIQDAPVAIGILHGAQLNIVQANEDLLKLWGRDENIIGKNLLDGLPELQNQPFIGYLDQVYKTGIAHHGAETLAILKRNGVLQDCYFNFVYDPIKDENNVVTGIMVVANEITSQVNARKEVAKSEERFRKLLLDTPIATGFYETEDIIITLANAEMLKFWGKGEEVIGKPMIDAVPELRDQPFIGILKEVYRTGIPYHADQQEAHLVINGELKNFYFNFTYKPLFNAEGKVYAILHAAIDVTKQVQLQNQKDEFLGIASHELKTPVTSIKAYAQVLERMIRNEGDERKANMVLKMDLQLNRLTGLIGDLLDVTKIQSGKMTFDPIKYNFDLAVADIVEDIQHTSTQHKINVELKSDALIFADKERIGQVITNFLSNAIKYSVDGDSIDVKSYVENNEVILAVSDQGIGIPKNLQHLIFDQFYRVGGNLQHTYPGLGLGLYISSEIIKNEEGRIWVESEEGNGSTFYFALKL